MTEFELIARIGQLFAGVPRNGFEKPGDDCTVLGIGGGESLLFTADLLTEGIHFLRNTTPPYELGRKALAVNLSDVAAMGGRSVATLLSVALPPDVSDEWTEAFLRGYRDLSAEEGVMLAGGDTTSSRHDITVNVTKAKQLTNMRASGSDDKTSIAPPKVFTLEEALEYIQGDEYVEVTPHSMRLRKILLDENDRKRAAK